METNSYEDPEMKKDKLPKPYRMLDKLINNIIDKAWKIILELELSKLQKESRSKFVKYEISYVIEKYIHVNCCESNLEINIVILGLFNGITLIDINDNNNVIAELEDDSLNIVMVKIFSHDANHFYFYTLDNLGQIKFFGFNKGKLYLLYNHSEINKNVIKKIKISSFSEYIGFLIEETDEVPAFIEIYSLPINQWNAELNHSTEDETSAQEMKFFPITYINKIGHPKDYMGGPAMELQINKYADPVLLEKIGLGINHCMSGKNIEERKRIFSLIHERYISLINQGKTYIHKNEINYNFKCESVKPDIPQFKFLTPWKFCKESSHIDTSVIAISWTKFIFLIFYDFKKEDSLTINNDTLNWPMANDIKIIKASACSNYLAFLTTNNTVTVYNRKYDLTYGCVAFESSILQLLFLDNYVGNKLTDMNLICEIVSILVHCATGHLFILVMNISGLIREPICIYESACGLESMPYSIKLVPSLPELIMLIYHEGPILLQSMTEMKTLCQLAIPQNYRFASCNFITFGCQKIALLVIYSQIKNLLSNNVEQKAFIYELWTYKELSQLKSLSSKEIILTINSTEAASAFIFKQILENQDDTKEKLKEVWQKLKKVEFKKNVNKAYYN